MSRNNPLLARATFPIIAGLYGQHRSFFRADGGDGSGGGGKKGDPGKSKTDPETGDDKDDDQKGEDKGKGKKIEIDEDELQDRIASAVKKREEELMAAAKKKEDDAAKELAKEQGKFDKLYQGEVELRKQDQAKVDELTVALRGKDVDLLLRDFLAEHQADYIKAAKYIRPLVEFDADTKDADLEKAIKAAVEQFVKDNPRSGGKDGAPGGAVGGKMARGTVIPEPKPNNQPQRREKPFSGLHR